MVQWLFISSYTYFMNLGKYEFQPLEDCFNVKNSSKVDAIVSSSLILLSFLQSWSFSKFRYKVQPLKPHGSSSAMDINSLEILCKRSHGKRTSPQARWVDLAARSSASSFSDRAVTEKSSKMSCSCSHAVKQKKDNE